jgi:putative DNA primase/helicase
MALRTDRTVSTPESHQAAFQAVGDCMSDLAIIGGVDPDDAQFIFSQERDAYDGPLPATKSSRAAAGASSPAPADDDISRLAKLPIVEYERQRVGAAKRLGLRTTVLDSLVETARPRDAAAPRTQGRSVSLPNPEPWPDAVDGAKLLTTIAGAIQQYVVLESMAADAIALWVIHTHAFDAAQVAPRLLVKSPEKRCGKSRLFSVINKLVRKPLCTSNVSPAALFRMIEIACPTVLIDEVDSFLLDNEEMRGIINSGHTRDAGM